MSGSVGVCPGRASSAPYARPSPAAGSGGTLIRGTSWLVLDSNKVPIGVTDLAEWIAMKLFTGESKQEPRHVSVAGSLTTPKSTAHYKVDLRIPLDVSPSRGIQRRRSRGDGL